MHREPRSLSKHGVPTTTLPGGEVVPVLGQGTWHMGDDPHRRDEEITALRVGLDLGLTLIDTAEMYGSGASEALVGQAIAGRRDEVFLVSKVLPQHASRRMMHAACEASLKRLGTDRLDLYLLHWPGTIPLEETVEAFEALVAAGRIRHWGVSNFDMNDVRALMRMPAGHHVATNQVLYNLQRRGIEWDLLPWSREHGLPVMAYSPIEQGEMLREGHLRAIAERHGATPAQIALCWILRRDGVIAIPKASRPEHVRENRAAIDLRLSDSELSALDEAFAPPRGPAPLEMI